MEDIIKRIMRTILIPLAVFLVGVLIARMFQAEGDITIGFIAQILILSPILTVLLLDLFRKLMENVDQRNERKLSIVFHISLAYFLVGLGIHYAANEIANVLTTPSPVVYLLDETLGHLVTYLGGAAIFAVLFISEHSKPYGRRISSLGTTCIVLTGVIFGLATAYAFVEGQTPYFGYLLEPISAILLPLIVRRRKAKFTQVPLTLLAMATVISGFVFSIVYGILFPGWPQPSEIF
jgi:hypothetical protein